MDRRVWPSSSGGLNQFVACVVLSMLALVIAGCSGSRSTAGDDTEVDVTASATAKVPPTATPTNMPTEQDLSTSNDEDVVGEAEDEEQTREKLTPEATESPVEGDDESVSWIRYENDEHGYTLEHPEGWIVGPPMHGSQHLVNDDRACAKCEGGTPSGTVLMHITPGISPPSAKGDPITVGNDIEGQIFYGGFAGDQDPERVFDIHYSTLNTDWWIYALFGDPIGEDNSVSADVFRIIEGIEHVSPPVAEPAEPSDTYELIDTLTDLNLPTGVAVDTVGHIYVAETGSNRVVKFAPHGEPLFEFRVDSNGHSLNQPIGVDVGYSDDAGFMYVTENGTGWIHHYLIVDDADSGLPGGVPLYGWGWDRQLALNPRGVAVHPGDLNKVYATVNDTIVEFTPQGDLVSSFEVGGELWGVAVDTDGILLVTDPSEGRLVRRNVTGVKLDEWYGLAEPIDVAIDSAGNIYVVELGNNRVVRLNSQGLVLDEVGSPAMFDGPRGVAVDDDGKVYVSDNVSVKIFKPTWVE